MNERYKVPGGRNWELCPEELIGPVKYYSITGKTAEVNYDYIPQIQQ